MRNSTTPFEPYFYSHYFNILPQSLLPTSSASSTSTTSTPTSGSPTTTNSDIVTSTTARSTTATQTASTSNSSTKIAVGVAVGVGVPLILVLTAIAFFLRRDHKRKSNSPKAIQQINRDVPHDVNPRSPPKYYDGQPFQPPQEMSQDNYRQSTRAELYADRMK